MRTAYIDCTPYGHSVLTKHNILDQVPDIDLYVGSPEDKDLDYLLRDTVGLINGRTIIDKAFLDRCNALKVIVFLGTGASTYIDLAETRRRGIEVRTVKGYGDRTIAEHTFALMLSASRNIASMDRELRQGVWRTAVGVELYKKRLGIIGVGGVGQQLITIADAFGMDVVAWNRSPIDNSLPCTSVSMDELLSTSDVISLHLALNDVTRNVINTEQFTRMKPNAILVNTGRGALINESALVHALQHQQIAHAALDVFGVEPLPANHIFTTLENITLTTHAAFNSDEAMVRLLSSGFSQLKEAITETATPCRP